MKNTKKPAKKIKVRDFKMWLSGFLEFQGDDWVPSKEQWNLIKSKLEHLEDEPEVVTSKQTTTPQSTSRQNRSPQPAQDLSPVTFDRNEDVFIDDSVPMSVPVRQASSLYDGAGGGNVPGSTSVQQHKTRVTDPSVVLPDGKPKSAFL